MNMSSNVLPFNARWKVDYYEEALEDEDPAELKDKEKTESPPEKRILVQVKSLTL